MSHTPEPLRAPEPLIPPLVLAACIAITVGTGILANCSVMAALIKSTKNGLSAILIQLAVADCLVLGTIAGPELWYFNSRTWIFGNSYCTAYRGLNVFATTASSYLITTVALHTISTVNQKVKEHEKELKREIDIDDEERGSSRHSLVASDSSTPPRTMSVDYRLVNTSIKVFPPSIFIWVLSASLCVPEFILSTTININQKVTLCIALDLHNKLNVNSILDAFNLFMPVIIMIIASFLVILKLKSRSFSHPVLIDSVASLKLSLGLLTSYFILCVPRFLAIVYNFYISSFGGNRIFSLEIFQVDDTRSKINIIFTGAYILSAVVHPILIITLLPNLTKMYQSNKNIFNV